MAAQHFNIEIRYYNGKPRLYVDVADNFSVTVSKFDGNDAFYAYRTFLSTLWKRLWENYSSIETKTNVRRLILQ